jgi:hypothetical protein
MSKNTKFKQYGIITLLVVVSIVLVGLIYNAGQGTNNNTVGEGSGTDINNPVVEEIVLTEDSQGEPEEGTEIVEVEAIEISEETETTFDEDNSESVIVEPITTDPVDGNDSSGTTADTTVEENIDEPMAEEPEKPELTPPEEQPETIDDLTNPDVVPDYEEEEITYTPEPEPDEPQDEVRGSNLVPDSENPFLQDDIPSNGDGGEVDVEDVSEYEPGTGDKF